MSGPARFDYVIVGGGLAGVSAIEGIREVDPAGSILMLSDEAEPPYNRPPLSKQYLQIPGAPRELLHIKPADWWEERGVRLELRQRVLALDPDGMRVTTARGNEYVGVRILLATGGRAIRPELPGGRLTGVHTLRTVEDSEAIRDAAVESEHAVLVGAGFIGMELAASLAAHGVSSTVVEVRSRVWPGVLPPPVADVMRRRFESEGVGFRLGSRCEGFEGTGDLRAVRVDGERVECGLAVIGVGMRPCDALAGDAGLGVEDGIVVDAYGETTAAGIYAAGDVARFPDPVFGGWARIEHWEHARAHGRHVGRSLAGERAPWRHLSYFFSDVFDISLNVVGRPARADELVYRGRPEEGGSVVFGIREGRVDSALMWNASGRLEACRALVAARPAADPLRERLADAASPIPEPG